MTRQKDLKRRVRSRMQKTGEAYVTARARVLAKKKVPRRTAATPAGVDTSPAGMADDKVRAATGRGWAEWVAELDAIGAAALPHRDIARHLRDACGVSSWWSQAVTVGYERIRGLRQPGQRREGTWDVNKSRTLPVPIARVEAAFATARGRARWLGTVHPRVRTSTPGKIVRFDWPDGTVVEAYVIAKGAAKTQVTVQHRKLPSKAEADRARAFWTERLGALAEVLG